MCCGIILSVVILSGTLSVSGVMSTIIPSGIIPSAIRLREITLIRVMVVMLNVIMLNAVMLNVAAPPNESNLNWSCLNPSIHECSTAHHILFH